MNIYNSEIDLYIDYNSLTTSCSSECFFSDQEMRTSWLLRQKMCQWTGALPLEIAAQQQQQQQQQPPPQPYRRDLDSSKEYRQNVFETLCMLKLLNQDEIGVTLIRLFVVSGKKTVEPNMELAFLNIAQDVIFNDGNERSHFKLELYFLLADENSGVPSKIFYETHPQSLSSSSSSSSSPPHQINFRVQKSLFGSKDDIEMFFLKTHPTLEAILYPNFNLASYMFLQSVVKWKRKNNNRDNGIIKNDARLIKNCLKRPVLTFHQAIALIKVFNFTSIYRDNNDNSKDFASQWEQFGATFMRHMSENCSEFIEPTYECDVITLS